MMYVRVHLFPSSADSPLPLLPQVGRLVDDAAWTSQDVCNDVSCDRGKVQTQACPGFFYFEQETLPRALVSVSGHGLREWCTYIKNTDSCLKAVVFHANEKGGYIQYHRHRFALHVLHNKPAPCRSLAASFAGIP